MRVRARSTASSRSSATPPTPRSMTKPTRSRVILLDACIGLAVPGRPIRSLVAEERSAGGVHDRTGRARRYTLGTRGAGTKRTASGTSVTTGAKEPQVRPPAQPPPGTTSGGGPEFKSPHRLPRAVRALGHEAVDHPLHASAHVGSDGLCRKFILRVGAGHRGQLPVSARHELRGPPPRGRLRGAPRHG